MPVSDFISDFAINIAASIAAGFLPHNSKTVVKQIKEAFEEAKNKCFSPEIIASLSFHRKWERIKLDITERITSAEDFTSLPEETKKILEEFKQAVASRPAAYNYLKDIIDSERYAYEFSALEGLRKSVDDANDKLDRITLQPFDDKADFLSRHPLNGTFLHNEYIDSIVRKLQDPESRVIRIIALSGMGKSRIVREAFSNVDSELYYCDDAGDPRTMAVLRTIFTQCPTNSIVILDNCSTRIFGEVLTLKHECGAEQRIISLGNDMSEPQQPAVELIRIQTDDLQEMVDDYIAQRLCGKENENYNRIAKFAEGIPYMAILLCDALVNNGKPGYVDNETIFHKLLQIDHRDPANADEKKVLEACALFMPLGYSNRYSCQADFVATNDYLTEIQGSDIFRKKKFREVCKKYIDRQLMEHVSDHINVRPMPLAIWLASEWFRRCTKEDILSLIRGFGSIPSAGPNHAQNMQEAFCKRLEYLTENRVAKEVMEELMRRGGPFAHEEILNTLMGSRLLLSFANAIPQVVTESLYDIYADYELEKLKSELTDDARRNVVYTLEKVCYNKSCFHKAALVLARLALAENETWSNNATGLFRQLFHILIPGTEASLDDRFEVIRACRMKGDEYVDIMLEAVDSALALNGFVLSKGAERQGFSVYQNYQPTYPEVFDYWQKCHDMLIEITEEYPCKLQEITTIVEKHVYDLLKVRRTDMFYRLLDYYIPKREYDWDKMLKTLHHISDNNEGFCVDKNKLEAYIVRLTRTDFYSRFIAVQENENRKHHRSYQETICAINRQYEKLAEEYVADHWNDVELLRQFYTNDFPPAAAFAQKVFELEKDDSAKREFFIERSIQILKENPDSRGKALMVFYCALIENREYLANVVDKIADAEAFPVLFATVGACRNKLDEVRYRDLFAMIANGRVDAKYIKEFLNYSFLSSDISIIEIYKDIASLGSAARITILNNIKWTVISRDASDLLECSEFIEQYVKALLADEDVRVKYFSDIMEIAEHYLRTLDKPDFAIHIHSYILKFLNSCHYCNPEVIYITLLDKYRNEIWPDLSNALLNTSVYFQLRSILGAHIGMKSGLLCSYYDEDILIQWCKENAPDAPRILASMIPVYQSYETKRFSNIMHKLLDLFGTDEDVLSNLSCNMGSFAWTGSIIPLLRLQLTALRELLNHKHYAVIRWAKQQIEYTEEAIQKEIYKEELDTLMRK
ncbi:hypothetical protein [uncultured Alistipes sp.]|uniref:hypothetical protein n=1 Tax=uncultured Alistipes sp. TaxID=538949 RepID=UPI00260795F3|nr:hypothetical protein [uncultured Alistipes sp.]